MSEYQRLSVFFNFKSEINKVIGNSKNSIKFILRVILVLLVALVSLGSSGPILSKNSSTVSAQKGDNLEFEYLSGLGIGIFYSQVDSYLDILLANGFTEFRIDIPDYQNTAWLNNSKAAVIRAVAKGAKVIWGVSSNSRNNPSFIITSSNWPAYRQAILDSAKWAQDNGVYEFQLGNEENFHNDDLTLTDEQLRINIRSVAKEVQAIYTRGNVSYTFGDMWAENAAWISEGKGDLDIIASNIYKGGSEDPYDLSYQTRITNLVNAFGVDGTYLTEFGLSYTSISHYSTDESVQLAALSEMVNFIRSTGMTRSLFFTLQSDEFGAIKDDGTYRSLWNVLSGEGTAVLCATEQTDGAIPGSLEAFITRLYVLSLSRDPDVSGLNEWVNRLTTGVMDGADAVNAFISSDEFLKRNVSDEAYVTILYKIFFNREPDSLGYNFWLDNLNAGRPRKWVLEGFINSAEFIKQCAAYGINPGSL